MVYRRTPEVQARQARTRANLVEAARSLVADGGLGAASMARVADRAGVGVGTVYRYFPSKAELIGEVVRAVCRHELDVVAAEASAADASPTDRLVATITTFARRAARSGRTAYAVIAEPAEAEVELLRLEIRAELAGIFAGIVADGVAAGDFPPQDPRVTGTALVGAVSEVLVGPLAPTAGGAGQDDAEVEETLTEIARFAVRAVAPAAAEVLA